MIGTIKEYHDLTFETVAFRERLKTEDTKSQKEGSKHIPMMSGTPFFSMIVCAISLTLLSDFCKHTHRP